MDINTNTAKVFDSSMKFELQKIQTYIKNTDMPENIRYDSTMDSMIVLVESAAIGQLPTEQIFKAVLLAFRYGQAKGYRQAKAEQKAKRQ